MFYTTIILHSSSKVIGNYHRILVNEHPNTSTFKAEFIDPSQLSLSVHQLSFISSKSNILSELVDTSTKCLPSSFAHIFLSISDPLILVEHSDPIVCICLEMNK